MNLNYNPCKIKFSSSSSSSLFPKNRLHQLTILAILLTTTSQLLSSADAVNAQNRRQRNRPVAKPSAKDANCQDMSEEQLMRDYVKEVSDPQRLGMHESFYQMEALREAFREESFEVFRNESRGLVHITRAPLDNESHEEYVNVLCGAG